MRSMQRPARAATVCALAAILTLSAGPAAAESFVRFGGGPYTSKIKFDDPTAPLDTKAKGSRAALDLRFDLPSTSVFLTFGAAGSRSDFPLDPTDPTAPSLSEAAWGYKAGLGTAFAKTRASELWIRGDYTHLRGGTHLEDPSGLAFHVCCATQDYGALAFGGLTWMASWVKVYGEAHYEMGSEAISSAIGHRKAKGYGVNAGLEFAPARTLRIFVEYDYRDVKLDRDGSADPSSPDYDPESSMKPTGIVAGFKVPFSTSPPPVVRRKKAAPVEETVEAPAAAAVPEAAAPVAPPVASPALPPGPAPGKKAMLKPGALLRAQPRTDGTELNTDASQPVTLKAVVNGIEGKWWYVTMPRGGGGWVEESRFDVVP